MSTSSQKPPKKDMTVKPTMTIRNLKTEIEEEEIEIPEVELIREETVIDPDPGVPVTTDSETGPDLEVTVDKLNL